MLASASILEIPHVPLLRRCSSEVMTTMRWGAKERHDQLPFRTVRPNAGAMQRSGHQMGYLMGHCLREKGLSVFIQHLMVIPD